MTVHANPNVQPIQTSEVKLDELLGLLHKLGARIAYTYAKLMNYGSREAASASTEMAGLRDELCAVLARAEQGPELDDLLRGLIAQRLHFGNEAFAAVLASIANAAEAFSSVLAGLAQTAECETIPTTASKRGAFERRILNMEHEPFGFLGEVYLRRTQDGHYADEFTHGLWEAQKLWGTVLIDQRQQYKAELYDEVWDSARQLGYGNVTMALSALKTHRDDAELLALLTEARAAVATDAGQADLIKRLDARLATFSEPTAMSSAS